MFYGGTAWVKTQPQKCEYTISLLNNANTNKS